MEPLLIDVTELLEHTGEERSFSGKITLGSIKLGQEMVEFVNPFDVRATLRSVSLGIVITGQAQSRVILRCSRCLEKFEYQAKAQIEEMAVADGQTTPDDVFLIQDGKIDLAAVVYQNVIVELPIQPLCRQICAGLCDVCGRNLNDEPHDHPEDEIDERLASLKEYFKKGHGTQ